MKDHTVEVTVIQEEPKLEIIQDLWDTGNVSSVMLNGINILSSYDHEEILTVSSRIRDALK